MTQAKRIELAGVIATMLQTTDDSKKLAAQIAGYLLQEHHTKDVDAVMRDVMTARARQGIIETQVTTAFPLSSQVKEQVLALLKKEYPAAKQFVLQQSVNPQVLAGIKLQTPDKQLDETARGKIDQLITSAA